MNWIERIHDRLIHVRRVNVLSDLLARIIPRDMKVLDIGSGDGWICSLLASKRPDLSVVAVDTFVREQSRFPVAVYDGVRLPYEDNSFDVAVFIDVLHHVDEMSRLLGEAVRVARRYVILKDHYCSNRIDRAILKYMDNVSNEHFGVALSYNYKSREEWARIYEKAGLVLRREELRLGLYPAVIGWFFERSLHMVVLLEKKKTAEGSGK